MCCPGLEESFQGLAFKVLREDWVLGAQRVGGVNSPLRAHSSSPPGVTVFHVAALLHL